MGPSQFCTEHRDSTLFKERAIPFLIVRKCFYILIFQSQRSFIFICEWKSCCTYENNFAWACLLRVIFFRWAMWPAGFLFKFWYRLKKKTNQSALHLGKIDCNSGVWFLAVPSPPKVKKNPRDLAWPMTWKCTFWQCIPVVSILQDMWHKNEIKVFL